MSDHTLGDAPIEAKYLAQMNAIAQALDESFNGNLKHPNKATGFVLLVFPFATLAAGDSRCNFISNGADRKDIANLFREMIARLEGMPYVEGKA